MNLSSFVLIDLVILFFIFDNRTGNAQHLEIVDSSPNYLLIPQLLFIIYIIYNRPESL
jgi:hypothetical protein